MNRFKKLMMVTTSPVDNEALNALRIANKMLVKENLTWDNFLSRMSSSAFDLNEVLRDMARHARAQESPRPRSTPPRPVKKQRPVRASEPFKKKVFKIRRDD